METARDQPAGFHSVVKAIGVKDGVLDFGAVVSDGAPVVSAVFTKSRFAGPAVIVSKRHLASKSVRAIAVVSGNANVATGERGLADMEEVAGIVGRSIGAPPTAVLTAATGVIGRYLPMERVRAGLHDLSSSWRPNGLEAVAEAIMTTDRRPKIRSTTLGSCTLTGIVKGAAMLEPRMATLLAFFFTDAELSQDSLDVAFREAVGKSFNRISVDGDTSTSDTAAIFANGLAGVVDITSFSRALADLAIELAKDVIRESEGATKLIEVLVTDAADNTQAERVAKSIINSPLVKTAIHGSDPNWGRVAMAIGKCSDDELDPNRIVISFGGMPMFVRGEFTDDQALLDRLRAYLTQAEVRISVELGNGSATATVWGPDLSEEYVRCNAEYTT